uniref:Uncharacterized protein n=1 Tax=Arundo donax TaxID=35708 RepID=A0A0A8Z2I0_ARUDO
MVTLVAFQCLIMFVEFWCLCVWTLSAVHPAQKL